MNTEKKSLGTRMKNSVLFKVSIITFLILILLIPMSMIKSIIKDRQEQRKDAIAEVSNKWAGEQTLTGPIITIPITYTEIVNKEESLKKEYIHLLPENISFNSSLSPEKLHRGIYEIVVYQSQLKIQGNFKLPDLSIYGASKIIHLDKAFLSVGITDLKGIKNDVKIKLNNHELNVTPGVNVNFLNSGITAMLQQSMLKDKDVIPFNFDLHLQGSQHISFIPTGKTTHVKLSSSWNSPSFFGNFLPDDRSVNPDGFSANWKVLELNRNFPQVWYNKDFTNEINKSAFGVSLKIPMDDYQKSMRSAKYAAMIISLTFIMFFLIETLNKKRIHPLQYILIGVALCLFYSLLISLSEHSNFNFAYLISSGSVIILISLYSYAVLKRIKIAAMIFTVILSIYSFVFVILQLTDFALLIGSIGLLLILAITMYATRNIDWYAVNVEDSITPSNNE